MSDFHSRMTRKKIENQKKNMEGVRIRKSKIQKSENTEIRRVRPKIARDATFSDRTTVSARSSKLAEITVRKLKMSGFTIRARVYVRMLVFEPKIFVLFFETEESSLKFVFLALLLHFRL